MIHAIILARGGSKGLKNKNLKKIAGKPMLFWSISACLKSKKIFKTWVSSDSTKILKFSKKVGASIISRPKKYATDTSTSESAWKHGVENIEKKFKIDTIVGIQPTSPIKTSNDLDNAIKTFLKKKFDSLFSSTEVKDYHVWQKDKKLKPLYNYLKRKRRQDYATKYLENGSFYIFNKNKFIKKNNRLFGKVGTYAQNKTKSFQVDDVEDIFIVNRLLSSKKINNFNK